MRENLTLLRITAALASVVWSALDLLPERKRYEGTKPRVLIMEGEGDLGKTETACAIMAKISGSYHFISKLDQLRTVTVEPDQGLVVDDLRMPSINVDDVKARYMFAKEPNMSV